MSCIVLACLSALLSNSAPVHPPCSTQVFNAPQIASRFFITNFRLIHRSFDRISTSSTDLHLTCAPVLHALDAHTQNYSQLPAYTILKTCCAFLSNDTSRTDFQLTHSFHTYHAANVDRASKLLLE